MFYSDEPKYSDSIDPNQTAPSDSFRLLLKEQSDQVDTVCRTVCIFWTHKCMIKPLCSNFRMITASFWVSTVQILGWLQQVFGCQLFEFKDDYSTFLGVNCSNFRMITASFWCQNVYGTFIWARSWENVSNIICKQQRRRSACTSAQTYQRLCCSLPR